MLTVRVRETYKNGNGTIIYRIQDIRTRQIKDVTMEQLKFAIANNQCAVTNFTLTSDGRLVEHKENTTVKIGNTYQYKIEYSYSDPLTEMTNLVIYSSLENAYGNNSYWQGTLSSIDTSSLQSIGLDYTIYYSYNSNLDLSNNRNLDLTRSDTWSSDTPNNMANVKAIAIDCSSNNITGVKIPIVYLNMISTLNRNDINKNAYNNSLIKFDTLGETKTISSNTSIPV